MSPGRLLAIAGSLGIIVLSVRGMASGPAPDPRPAHVTHNHMLPGTFTLNLNGSTFACSTATQNVVNCTSADIMQRGPMLRWQQ
jgi:hypothetical protein